ncbi:sodium ion-translocating decarboxylase subunit beta [Salmonella enterica subsp. enterica serovar Weltevreden]|nr:sodium ion-translocating decarboxylase subunit beta [Salmonella enterica subsp. enterica serovar Weltevreden]
MALVPLIQPPIMSCSPRRKSEKSAWCSCGTVSSGKNPVPSDPAVAGGAAAADAAPLLGMFCFGNLMRESGVVERLSDTVQNGRLIS